MSSEILLEIVDGVAIISFNRPDRHNAFNDAMGEIYEEVLYKVIDDPEVKVILLRGNGKSFCSGRDVTQLGQRARDESDYHFVRRHQDKRFLLMDCQKIVIAAVKGATIGGGCETALAADIRVSSDNLKMSLPEINYGILPDTGGTQNMTALIGPSRTKYMVLSGDAIDAKTAHDWGAVDFVVPDAELDEFALNIAKKIAAKPPIALSMGKTLIDNIFGPRIRQGMRQELTSITTLFKSQDYQEARNAIKEKRKPKYIGK